MRVGDRLLRRLALAAGERCLLLGVEPPGVEAERVLRHDRRTAELVPVGDAEGLDVPVRDDVLAPQEDAVERSVYSGRAAKAEEVAQAIFWLGTSSPDSLSGTTVDVNNGSYPR